MRIALITPARPGSRAGNRHTALRWAAMLRAAGHRVTVSTEWEPNDEDDLLLALHARRSHASIRSFKDLHPDRPLVLALTGTYGVIAYIASARTKEFAIRSALGANAGRVMRLVLGRGVALTGLGLALGLAGAVLAAPLVNGLPITVRPPGVATVVPVAAFIAVAALAACLVPALRAARVSPMVALRDE